MKTMNQYFFFPVVLLAVSLLTGCGDRSGKTDQTTTVTESGSAVAPQTVAVCYQQVMGRDTTMANVVINGSVVMGDLTVMPAEKDQAKGPFRGTLTNDRIVADWQRSGEGVTQVYEVNFSMVGDSLLWREGERTEKQGKWVLVNPDKGFQYRMAKIICTQ